MRTRGHGVLGFQHTVRPFEWSRAVRGMRLQVLVGFFLPPSTPKPVLFLNHQVAQDRYNSTSSIKPMQPHSDRVCVWILESDVRCGYHVACIDSAAVQKKDPRAECTCGGNEKVHASRVEIRFPGKSKCQNPEEPTI